MSRFFRWPGGATLAAAILNVTVIGAVSLRAAPQTPAPPTSLGKALPAHRTGQDIYRATCATCHGRDGKGQSRNVVGFDAPIPDFTDCAFATAEPDPDWQAVVHQGGPIRGLTRYMPAFGDALSNDDIVSVVAYIRGFCTSRSWPQGDLNLPRAFFTEKAFPENESLWTTTVTRQGEASVANALIYERRFGSRSQIEVVAPVDFLKLQTGEWTHGLGDVAVAFKHAFFSSMETGSIAAAGAEVILPTGKEDLGLGSGVTIYEGFAMWGQILPRNSFFQMHAGFEIPADSTKAAKEVYVRSAIGTTLAQDRGFGRAWSPQVEVLWARPFGEASEWDIVPQLQISLSKLQHVLVAAGVRVPLTQRAERPKQVLFYFLWDWYDGSLFDFWK